MSDMHPSFRLNELCSNISAIINGQAAQELLDKPERPTVGHVVTLPSWVWRVPVIDVGRKGRTATGDLLSMPARLVWDGSPVQVFTNDEKSADLGWRVTGLGHDEKGQSGVHLSGDIGVQSAPQSAMELTPDVGAFSTSRGYVKLLTALVENGTAARWEIVNGFESFTRTKLARANSSVAAELGEYHNYAIASVIDEIGLDDLLSQMLYGDGGSSVISRMVDRGLKPDTFNKVDPMHYFSANIRARAEEAVRRRIGDPKVGPKVRRIFIKSNAKNINELLEAYRAAYPRDALAKKRAIAALTSGSDAMVHSKFLYEDSTVAGQVASA